MDTIQIFSPMPLRIALTNGQVIFLNNERVSVDASYRHEVTSQGGFVDDGHIIDNQLNDEVERLTQVAEELQKENADLHEALQKARDDLAESQAMVRDLDGRLSAMAQPVQNDVKMSTSVKRKTSK